MDNGGSPSHIGNPLNATETGKDAVAQTLHSDKEGCVYLGS
jgi:hypothetical protein